MTVVAADELPPPNKHELLVIVGPTGSGKTALAIALAKRFNAEIVGADSVQIYRHFDIGSGKPSADERDQAPHHLIDFVDPLESFDAARFAELADEAIAAIHGRERPAIVCGGTFLWLKALLHGLVSGPSDNDLRTEHKRIADTAGRAALHEKLKTVDPEAAARLAPADFVRVSRALEIYELTGRTQSAWFREHGFRDARYHYRLLGAAHLRAELDERIATRTTAWLNRGWIDEVRALCKSGYRDARALTSVGYRQVRDHIDGTLDVDLHTAIVRSTRKFIRRQRTWIRDEPVTWLR